METHYNPQQIEQEAQRYWEDKQCFTTTEDLDKEKYYCLAMFPYPSGNLHIGHVRNYTLADVIARYQRMLGKNVLQPFGWDAFGLPAENAAIKHKTAPSKWTYHNIKHMRTQLKQLGFGIDWSRELATCHPDYYRWEQWLFTKLFAKGLAYKKHSAVNWDPVDCTVLANEQVINGRGWRSGALVERKEISQWFLKITDYAEELLSGLDQLQDWPEQVRTMQRNWIGKSEGVDITFKLSTQDQPLTVYTTRPDTLFGVSYIAISPEHPIATKVCHDNKELTQFVKQCKQTKVAEADIASMEKCGMDTGIVAINPINGAEVAVWICNYVINSYSSGAVMAVPAHDQRDYEFADKYNLPKLIVIANHDGNTPDISKNAYTQKNTLINSQDYSGFDSQTASTKITDFLVTQKLGTKSTKYRLRDWGISRQRYWGAPIPIIYCDDCGEVPVPEDDLPVRLPENIEFSENSLSLKDIPEFYKTICPRCGVPATRETDTFDTFMESSWYYARYASPRQANSMLDNRAQYWTPVDQYIGGIEHAVMHLLYARFMHKVLRDEGLLNSDEPIKKLLTQGMVLKDGVKMSKSKGNTVDPDTLIKQYGADSVRVFITFTAPPEQSLEWSDQAFEGSYRFLKRLWAFSIEQQAFLVEENNSPTPANWDQSNTQQKDQWREIHTILQQASYDYERLQLNTVVSGCMKLFNILNKITIPSTTENNGEQTNRYLLLEGFKILLCLLSPIAPHLCHKIWRECKYGSLIINAPWPTVSSSALQALSITMVIQVNGKLRSKLVVSADTDQETLQKLATTQSNIQPFIEGKKIHKVIVVPKKLINIVAR